MPDKPTTTASNGAAAPPEEQQNSQKSSLREIAEAAYDEVIDTSEDVPEGDTSGQNERTRDNLGRFIAKPGEAADEQKSTQPGLDEQAAPQPADQQTPHPAPKDNDQGSSSEAPQNWKAEHRLMFSKQTPEAQKFLLDRHSELEGDYQRKVQATAQAAGFVHQLAPIFSDPVIAGSLQQSGLSPSDAIREWGAMHRRAMSPNLRRSGWTAA